MLNTAQEPTGSVDVEIARIAEGDGDSNESWLQFYHSYFNYTYHVCIAPFRIQLDPVNKRPLITTNKAQKIICIILQCSSLLFIRLQFKAVWDYVQGGTDRASYFDLLLVFLLYGIDVLIKLKFWGGTQQFSVLIHEISYDKRLRVRSSWGPFKVRLLIYSICVIYLIPSAVYVTMVIGVDPSDAQGTIKGIKAYTESVFAASLASNGMLPLVQQVVAMTIAMYASCVWQYGNVFVLISNIFWYRVTSDFFDALERGDIDDMEVVSHYEKFKELNQKFNSVVGWMFNYWVCYPIFHYGSHLVDMLQQTDWRNRLTMCFFLGHYVISLMFAAQSNLRANNTMATWIRRHGFPHVDAQRLKVILFDLQNNKVGLRGLFTVTMGFAGGIINLILTLAVIAIQFRL